MAAVGRRLLAASLLTAASGGQPSYMMRETVRVGHRAEVQLPGGRHVDVVTVSDRGTGLPAFLVDGLLTVEECSTIRSAAPADLFHKSEVSKDFPVLEALQHKEEAAGIFKESDTDGDGKLDASELGFFVQQETDMVEFNYTELLAEEFRASDAAAEAAAGRALSKTEFLSLDWSQYVARVAKSHPERFARHSSQAWLNYTGNEVLQTLLEKVAAVTGLPHQLVVQTAEDLQLLRYEPHGAHYSCHHDSSPDVQEFRFMTVFIFLNDVTDGGETMLFGTDLNGTYPERRSWGPDQWSDLEQRCQPFRTSCPPSPGVPPPPPFSSAVVVRPKMGSVLFWYNMEVDGWGRRKRFLWSSIHGGCPTRSQEKWAANVWLHGNPKTGKGGKRRPEL